ncbi:tyrosine-protein phosphatase [Adhaeretor mobilis]|uniref:protein-tyrosine-phosphatase n=1 Tax=Adhaeretor mobilis TaxID=1930276 RepID=A0A517MPX7_9BACT|nr:CpsB/CapC family capsule biosynthesis tyrosine phosphatase [Adhaeretor mobilis]QDS96943.1 Tyrosine-protein phosphatase YwqE [Adhaeretor mobilis]
MDDEANLDWLPAQKKRLAEFNVEQCVDIHCHLLPGLDDGPADMSQAVALGQALAEDGVTTVVTTPHQLGRYDRLNSAELINQRIAELASVLEAEQVPLKLLPGGDIRIDERLTKLLDNGDIISLANAGAHLLLELPHELLVDPLSSIEMLVNRGLQPIITHPERHLYLAGRDELLQRWVDAGAVIQLTAGSLLGDFGRRAHHQAWQILQLGLASLVATDAHDVVRRPPRLTRVLSVLTDEVGASRSRILCIDNPLLVLRGSSIAHPQTIIADA